MGLEARKKSGLASFWSPANRNVTPRNRRSGIRYQPAAMVPSEPRSCHMSPGVDLASEAELRVLGVADCWPGGEVEVTAGLPCLGTIPVAPGCRSSPLRDYNRRVDQ